MPTTVTNADDTKIAPALRDLPDDQIVTVIVRAEIPDLTTPTLRGIRAGWTKSALLRVTEDDAEIDRRLNEIRQLLRHGDRKPPVILHSAAAIVADLTRAEILALAASPLVRHIAPNSDIPGRRTHRVG